MKLVMYFGVELLDAVWLDAKEISRPGYLGSLKRQLMKKHALQEDLHTEPEFLILHPAQQSQQKSLSL